MKHCVVKQCVHWPHHLCHWPHQMPGMARTVLLLLALASAATLARATNEDLTVHIVFSAHLVSAFKTTI